MGGRVMTRRPRRAPARRLPFIATLLLLYRDGTVNDIRAIANVKVALAMRVRPPVLAKLSGYVQRFTLLVTALACLYSVQTTAYTCIVH